METVRLMSQSTNPYRPPTTVSEPSEKALPEVFVDGPYLVVKSGVKLPRSCIKTNQLVGEKDFMRQRLGWRGKAFRLVLTERQCDLVWYAKPEIVRKQRFKLFARSIATPLLLFPAFFVTMWYWVLLPVLFLGLLICFAGVLIRPALRVVNYKKDRFWIKGCSADFLRSLEEESLEQVTPAVR